MPQDEVSVQDLVAMEKRVIARLLEFDVSARTLVAVLVMAIARVADATEDNAGVADYLVQNADLIRQGLAMEARS